MLREVVEGGAEHAEGAHPSTHRGLHSLQVGGLLLHGALQRFDARLHTVLHLDCHSIHALLNGRQLDLHLQSKSSDVPLLALLHSGDVSQRLINKWVS